jgi:hypothetical protein
MCISSCSYTYTYAAELDRKFRSCSIEKVLFELGESDSRYHTPNWTFAIRARTSRACHAPIFESAGCRFQFRVDIQRFLKHLFYVQRHGLEKVEDLEGVVGVEDIGAMKDSSDGFCGKDLNLHK